MRIVLDTSVLIGDDLSTVPGEIAISAASIAELHFGVLVTADSAVRAQRLRRLVRLGQLFDPLPIDEAVAQSYGQIAASVADAGRQPRARVMDLLIAATAHAHDATLYTRNAVDLVGVEDLVEIVTV